MRIDFSSLNKEEFERMCKRLLIAENPKIKTIDGTGGDEGIDSFLGTINKEIQIWQFKFFMKRLNPSRKKQIETSLKTAKKKHELKMWTLCLPMEFSPSEERWFQQLTTNAQYKKINIDHWNIHKLTNLLQKHKAVRDEFFREEEKDQLDRIEKGVQEIRTSAVVRDVLDSQAYAEQVSAFRIMIFNKSAEDVVKLIKAGAPKRQGLGFSTFRKKDVGFYQALFNVPSGTASIKVSPEDDNPFKLIVPQYAYVSVWIKTVMRLEAKHETQVTFFTSNYGYKQLLWKMIKDCLPETTIMSAIEFNKKIKTMMTDRKKFAPFITTVALDPDIIEQVLDETGKENIDVTIKSNIIHANKGGLPETQFMQKALTLVKPIRSSTGVSDIRFFRAKQTDRAIPGKTVTLDLHNDGRIRFWFKKTDFKSRDDMLNSICSFIDRNS